MELDDELCLCFHVSKRKVLNYLRVHQPRVASQLTECGGAGTGCGWCVPFLKRLHQKAQAGDADVGRETSAGDYAKARAEYIRAGKGTPPPGATPIE
ncbi:MAG: (2Fe-2S)-binding protein [Planctomycetaceae bacterium]|nr:(2Fe-2S)-binding protein [Planctomycetaceae bacterium]